MNYRLWEKTQFTHYTVLQQNECSEAGMTQAREFSVLDGNEFLRLTEYHHAIYNHKLYSSYIRSSTITINNNK